MNVVTGAYRRAIWCQAVVGLAFWCLAGLGLAVMSGPALAQDNGFETQAKQAILMDSRSGEVFYEKAADDLMPPASMSKIMTMLVVFEALKAGELSLDDEFVISEDAWRRGGAVSGGSTMYAELNSRVKLDDLIHGVIVQSANDAAIVIAEGMAGSEAAFADKMTDRARFLGLEKSTFKNATGLPDPEHLVTARELAWLTRYLIEVFPQFYKLYSVPEFTWNNIRQFNRNPLLGSYPGADGVKTGYIRAAGFGLVASAERDGRRLIAVLNGLKSRSQRAQEAQRVLDWGFRQFRPVDLYQAGERVGKARVWGGERAWVPLVTKSDVRFSVTDDERGRVRAEIVYRGPLLAPVEPDMEVGSIRLTIGGKLITQLPLFTGRAVQTSDAMWRKALDSLSFMFFGG